MLLMTVCWVLWCFSGICSRKTGCCFPVSHFKHRNILNGLFYCNGLLLLCSICTLTSEYFFGSLEYVLETFCHKLKCVWRNFGIIDLVNKMSYFQIYQSRSAPSVNHYSCSQSQGGAGVSRMSWVSSCCVEDEPLCDPGVTRSQEDQVSSLTLPAPSLPLSVWTELFS